MAKFDPYSLSSKERNNLLGEFYSFANSLRTRGQIANFFKDLLTPSEAVMLARRIQIAKMLLKGDNYEEIKRELKVGVDTIVRVQRWLRDGFGGYIKALEKVIKKEESARRSKEEIEIMKDSFPNSLPGLAYRYPLYWGLTYELYKMLRGRSYGKERRGRKKIENAKKKRY